MRIKGTTNFNDFSSFNSEINPEIPWIIDNFDEIPEIPLNPKLFSEMPRVQNWIPGGRLDFIRMIRSAGQAVVQPLLVPGGTLVQ